jgi:hypothetical protein
MEMRPLARIVSVVVLVCSLVTMAQAERPEVSDPEGLLADGTEPGEFPTRVTAANVNIFPLAGGELNGANQDNLLVTFPGSGPIPWTESRHNEGDIALLIGPAFPDDPTSYPPEDFVDNFQAAAGSDDENATLAWRVGRATGALFATVRHNGVDQQITVGGRPLGITHGVAYFNDGFSQGWGFRMEDGVYANGGGASSDLQMGIAGADDATGEASFSVATAYFPYEQGWLGGWVAAPVDEVGQLTFASPELDNDVVSWFSTTGDLIDGAVGRVELPDVNSATDGMLFVAPTNSDNAANIAAASPRDGGWDVAVREDDDNDLSGETLALNEQSAYQFLYIPYDSSNLVGGHVQGSDGGVVAGGGTDRFTLARRAAGEYGLTIRDEQGNTLAEDDGMLLLSVADTVGDPGTLPSRAFMSYEFDAASGQFIVQARELTGNDPATSENDFGEVFTLTDTNFYFAFVDFTNPLSPPGSGPSGDFNGDGVLGIADIDDLTAQVAAGGAGAGYDLNGDSAVNELDIQVWVKDLANSWIGDANLDGQFNSSDLVSVLASGTYEAEIAAVWSTGDFNGDGRTNSSDLVVALADGGYEAGPRAATAAVPEPSSVALLILPLALGLRIRRRD